MSNYDESLESWLDELEGKIAFLENENKELRQAINRFEIEHEDRKRDSRRN